ncbi:hypothetical protein BFX80_09480 [Cobetia marina]|nr:hypothetical protein BFX80_09480 [Cobetia marina]
MTKFAGVGVETLDRDQIPVLKSDKQVVPLAGHHFYVTWMEVQADIRGFIEGDVIDFTQDSFLTFELTVRSDLGIDWHIVVLNGTSCVLLRLSINYQ